MKARILLALLLTFAASYRYCEVGTSDVKVFTTQYQVQQEVQQLQLSKHFKGYDLEYSSSNPDVATIFEPYQVVEVKPLPLKTGYLPLNVDGKNSNHNVWGREGVVVAQADSKSIAVGYGYFKNDLLPEIDNFTYFSLPTGGECYSGHIYDSSLSVVVDCSSETQDIVCSLTSDGNSHCNSYPSITGTGKRISLTYTQGSQSYLLSAASTRHISSAFQNETFINIYHMIADGPDFNLIVDRHSLNLDSLSIMDMDLVQIHGVSYILVADANSRLILFRYLSDNRVGEVREIPIEGTPSQVEISAYNEWIVTVDAHILVFNFNQETQAIQLSRKYELDPSDAEIVDIQSSVNHITVRSSKNVLYTYDKKDKAIQYLLNREQLSESTAVTVSPFFPRLFTINATHMLSAAMTSGYIYISKVQEDTQVTITAKSGDLACSVNLHIQIVGDGSKIYSKKELGASLKFENSNEVRIPLSDYFGGSNLKYGLNDPKSKDITYNLQHFKKYTQQVKVVPDNTVYMTRIVEVDRNSYWFVTFSDTAIQFYLCTVSNASVNCNEDKQSLIPSNETVLHAESGKKEDGSLILAWTYSSSKLGMKALGKKGFTFVMSLGWHFSSILVGQKFTCFVEKTMNRISFYYADSLKSFTKADFSQTQLQMMGGFYPRAISADPNNPRIFYIKFPISIVTVAYFGDDHLEILSVVEVSHTFIPDDDWTFLIGSETMLLFTPLGVSEHVQVPDSSFQKLHNIATDGKVVSQPQYQHTMNTAFFMTESGSMQFIRMNSNSLECQYYKVSSNGVEDEKWSISESWLYTSSGDVYYQYKNAALVITPSVPDATIQESFVLDLTVNNDAGDKKEVISNLTAINYQSMIKGSSSNSALNLPAQAETKILDFPIDQYFTGSVADFKISCPFTIDGSLQLQKPFQLIKDSDSVSSFHDIITLPDHSGVVTLYNNTLTISSINNTVINQVPITSRADCKWMDNNEREVVVFCVGSDIQQIAWLQLNDENTHITYKSTYALPADAVIQNPFEIACYGKDPELTVLIHDKEQNVDNSRRSNIKVLHIGQDITYVKNIDSLSFGVETLEPINSMSVMSKHMLVSIGGLGLGYINLDNLANVGQLVKMADISKDMLDDSLFLRVLLYRVDKTGDLQVFLTTSNSYNYLVGMKVQPGGVVYNGVKETYNKYGKQRILNWALLNEEHVILGYYNATTTSQSIVLYRRSTKGVVNFFGSSQFVVSPSQLHPPKSVLIDVATIKTKSSLLFIDESAKPSAAAKLGMYNITGKYTLMANYSKAGNFNEIKVTAKNDYSSVSRSIEVSFDGQESDGLKWYSVVIVACLVLIAVGVAFGLYLKMKARKSDSKKVSLFTENEEVDEVI